MSKVDQFIWNYGATSKSFGAPWNSSEKSNFGYLDCGIGIDSRITECNLIYFPRETKWGLHGKSNCDNFVMYVYFDMFSSSGACLKCIRGSYQARYKGNYVALWEDEFDLLKWTIKKIWTIVKFVMFLWKD